MCATAAPRPGRSKPSPAPGPTGSRARPRVFHLPPPAALGRLGSRSGQRNGRRGWHHARRADRPRPRRILPAGGPPTLRGADRRAGDRERYGRRCGLRGRGLHSGERPATQADPAGSLRLRSRDRRPLPARPPGSQPVRQDHLAAPGQQPARALARLRRKHRGLPERFLPSGVHHLLSHRFALRAPAPYPRDPPGLGGDARLRGRERAGPGAPPVHQALYLRRLSNRVRERGRRSAPGRGERGLRRRPGRAALARADR